MLRSNLRYFKLILEQAEKQLDQGCPGIQFYTSRDNEGSREWMMIDFPDFYRINKDKTFDDTCKWSVLGVNATITLLTQEMYDAVKKE